MNIKEIVHFVIFLSTESYLTCPREFTRKPRANSVIIMVEKGVCSKTNCERFACSKEVS